MTLPKEPCAYCGTARWVRARTPAGPACKVCYSQLPISLRHCDQCGAFGRLYHYGLCDRCACEKLLRGLLGGTDGQLRPHTEPVFEAIAREPSRVLLWLRPPAPRAILEAIGQLESPVTHDFLDDLEPRKSVQHLRAILVDSAVLAPRDEQLVALERGLDTTLDAVADDGERQLVRRFVTWTHLRRLRRQDQMTSYAQIAMVRREISRTIELLTWIHAQGRTLATCTQADIDAWLDQGPTTATDTRNFIKWAARRGHAGDVEVPARVQRNLRSTFIEDDERWTLIRRLLHDDSIDIEDRVAGLLVLLFAQPLAKITQLTVDHIDDHNGDVQLTLGPTPLRLPPPLDRLVAELAATTARTNRPWLFPGRRHSSHHISTQQLMARLHRLGIRARPGRNTAMMSLAAELPAIVVSHLLGLNPNTANKWGHEAGAPRAGYAAELSRRAREAEWLQDESLPQPLRGF